MRRNTLLLTAIVVASAAAALGSGVSLHWSDLFVAGSDTHRIVFELRLPRALFVFLAGATLAAVGAVYQILFHNPLAEPFLLGISTAAVLGIASAEVLSGIVAPSPLSQVVGLSCAGLVTSMMLFVSSTDAGNRPERVALFGVGVNFVLSSVLFLLLSYQSQHIGGGSLRWLFGQVPWVGMGEALRFGAVSVFLLVALIVCGRGLDALGFGDGVARTLGFVPGRQRFLFLALTSGLVAWLASFTGSIGFVGLVIPHLVRMLFHPGTSRRLLAWAIPAGGAFLLLSDAVSRSMLPPMEFPIGIITTIVGGPLFLYLLWKRR